MEAQREQNAKLTTVLATERITCSRVPGLESHISSLQRELEETKESNTTLLAKLAAEERLTLSKCGRCVGDASLHTCVR